MLNLSIFEDKYGINIFTNNTAIESLLVAILPTNPINKKKN